VTDPLPRPTVTSESSEVNGSHKISVTVRRDGAREKTYVGASTSVAGAARELVEKIFDDPGSTEFVRKG